MLLPSSLAIPVSTRICLNPPPAATMSKMLAIGGSAAPTLSLIASRFMPEGKDRQQGCQQQGKHRLAKEIQDTADGGAFESEDIGEGLAHHEDDR